MAVSKAPSPACPDLPVASPSNRLPPPHGRRGNQLKRAYRHPPYALAIASRYPEQLAPQVAPIADRPRPRPAFDPDLAQRPVAVIAIARAARAVAVDQLRLHRAVAPGADQPPPARVADEKYTQNALWKVE